MVYPKYIQSNKKWNVYKTTESGMHKNVVAGSLIRSVNMKIILCIVTCDLYQ